MSPVSPIQQICREWMKELGFYQVKQRLAWITGVTKHEPNNNYGRNVDPRRRTNNQITIFERQFNT